MLTRLLLYPNYREDAKTVRWICLSPSESKPAIVHETDWSELPTIKAKDEVILIVPAIDIIFKMTHLPRVSHQKMAQALPYIFEEQLADNVQNLHFVYVRSKDNHLDCIAITKKSLMQRWLSLLEQNKLVARAIIPENLLLPLYQDGPTIFIHHEVALIRDHINHGASIETDLLATYLHQWFSNQQDRQENNIISETATQIKAEKISHGVLHIYSPVNKKIKSVINKIEKQFNLSAQWHEPGGEPLAVFSQTLQSKPATLNLLQAEFKPPNGVNKRHWIISAALSISVLAFIFISSISENVILRSQLNDIEQDISTSYKTIFPDATSVTAPQIRIQQRIDSLRQAQQSNPFLQLLSIAGETIQRIPGIRLTEFSYNNNGLTLTLESPSATLLDNLNQRLQQSGIQIVGNTITGGENITLANLTITLPELE